MKKYRARFPRGVATGAAGMLLATILGGSAACGTPASEVPDETPPAGQGAPPPISGGTLLVLRDGVTAVAADSDRDSVWIVDLAAAKLRSRVRTQTNSEPGRVVEDQDGKVHVALRRTGQVVTIDPSNGAIVATRQVCAAPRGLAYESGSDNLHVACAGGELVTLKARGGEVQRTLRLGSDLRDVVVSGSRLLVSRFRTAEILEVDAAGAMVRTVRPRTSKGPAVDKMGALLSASPTQAYRMVPMPDGGALMLHQRSIEGNPIVITPGGYSGGPCKAGGISNSSVTVWGNDLTAGAGIGGNMMLTTSAVDVAVTSDGKHMAVIGGSINPRSGSIRAVNVEPAQLGPSDPCVFAMPPTNELDGNAEYTAGSFDNQARLWLQSRQPAMLSALGPKGVITIPLTGAEDRTDPGHQIFHQATNSNLACSSCHGEAGDDGHVWNFSSIGPRRTQNLRGGVLATAPFHWDGDMKDLNTLMQEVFTGRMSGPTLTPTEVASLGRWLDGLPPLPKSAPRDPEAVARGKALFEDESLQCTTCHSGAHFTNNQSVSVGTGAVLQVPALTDLGLRAPYMHNGCATTLRDRFTPACGGGDVHGKTSQLTSGQLDDLVAYLETL